MRFDAVPRAENPPDHLIAKTKRRSIASTQLKGLVFPTEAAFRTPYGGKVQTQAQMRGQAEPSRMGDALTVTEQHFGRVPEFAVSLQHGGHLTEGEQTRNVGKGDGGDDMRALEEAELRPLERHHDRHQLIRRGERRRCPPLPAPGISRGAAAEQPVRQALAARPWLPPAPGPNDEVTS